MMNANGKFQDHSYLIRKSFDIIECFKDEFTVHTLGCEKLLEEVSYGKSNRPGDFVVLGEDTAVELGSPRTQSFSRVLWSYETDIATGKLYVHDELTADSRRRELSFLQFIFVEVDSNADPYETRIYNLKNLTNKIPGYMTRSIPEKLWVRIHRKLLKKQFSLVHIGEALYRTYSEELPGFVNMDILLIAGNDNLVSRFTPISNSAKIISGENRKLKWEKDGVVSCDDLDCDNCEEQEACETIRDIVVRRRK